MQQLKINRMNLQRMMMAVLMLMMVSIGAEAKIDVQIANDGKFTGGTIEVTNQKDLTDGVEVTITVTPNGGYTIKKSAITVVSTYPPSGNSNTRTPEIANNLTLYYNGSEKEDIKDLSAKRNYTFIVPSGFGAWVKKAEFVSESKGNRGVNTYYAIHNKDKGYLKQAKGAVANDATFRHEDAHSDNGSSIWVMSSDGYLQQEMYYLNVANGQTLYLSPEKVTHWVIETVDGKNRLKPDGSSKYLCADNGPQLKESPSNYYNACTLTITPESKWDGPKDVSFTVQSPQLVTYLRTYYIRNITVVVDKNDNEETNKKVVDKKDSRCYQMLTYKSGGSNKGTNWDITSDGVIYNKTTSNQKVKATYTLTSLDPIALSAHSAVDKDVELTIQPQPITPNASKNYILYSIKAGDDFRYPYDDGISEGGIIKPDGKGGTFSSSVLTDPASGGNSKISWKVTVDDEGFYNFQNVNTSAYIYFDDTPHASSDYGAVKVGATTLPTGAEANKYRFRLYKTSNTDYGTCYQIIPYSKQFAVFKSDGVASGAMVALNNNDYKSKETKVISLYNANGNSQWCIYKYEAEYRVRADFTFSGPTTASATGEYEFTSSDGWYGKYITESPKEGNAQRGLVISGTYNTDKINYIWTIIGLDDYVNHEGWTERDGGFGVTNVNNKKQKFTVTSLPVSSASGVVQLQLRGGENDKVNGQDAETNPKKWTIKKTMAFTIMGNGTISFTEITTLSDISNSNGAYRLTEDIADASTDRPEVSSFSGILDCNNHTIKGLDAPLFTTLTNGTVCNLNLEDVAISQATGNAGAIAATANGGSRIYNVGILGGSVGGKEKTGGLVGLLDGSARVINCFSYATITAGTDVGGIVGYNNYASTASDIRTMVMNCMFYGDITGGTTVSPVYGGNNINNLQGGLNTFNYYAYSQLKTKSITNDKYNCALAVEEKYLNRFEFYRLLLNSNKKLAAFYATGSADNANQMAKWVLETADRQITNPSPYPVLKAQGRYFSIINPDFTNAPDSTAVGPRKGGKLKRNNSVKKLTVTISEPVNKNNPTAGQTWPSGAAITNGSLTLDCTDMDEDRFNFNYDKVQLPYYNDCGTGNYTGNRVVTGWIITNITSIDDDPYTSANYDYTKTYSDNYFDYPNYNFADRKSSNKDKYSVSGRVFSQGAYFDVPYGVTSITIEPYWAKAAYISDPNYDAVYKSDYSNKQNVTQTGTQVTVGTTMFDGEKFGTTAQLGTAGQKVETSIADALTYIKNSLGGYGPKVYDNAVVLVGNFHQYAVPSQDTNPFTLMSVDVDNDHEPDYSLIYHHTGKKRVCPIRFDFLNIPGTAQAQKPNGASLICNMAIIHPSAWFEITNTSSIYFSQLEYEDLVDNANRTEGPLILQGGVLDQFVSTNNSVVNGKTIYMHLGSNVWLKEFNMGTHSDGSNSTPHPPVSVTGGEYEGFYLTGTYNQDAKVRTDNAECYISGGHFIEAAGTGQEAINGNVRWQIYNAYMDNFYGGGTNGATGKNIKGNVTVDIFNSHVTTFCGGPKFGNMESDKKVTTNAEGCVFGRFFGAGYGGTAYSRKKYYDKDDDPVNWTTQQSNYTTDRGKYFDGKTNGLGQSNKYGFKGIGVATDFDYEYFVWSSGKTGGRFFVKFASFSLATCKEVESNLKNCIINENFYGGGKLGKVEGTVTSVLDGCTVKGNVFGAGFSATIDPVPVRDGGFSTPPKFNKSSGMFEPATPSGTTPFIWKHVDSYPSNGGAGFDGTQVITTENLNKSNLGSVDGNVNLTIKGKSKIGTVGDTSGTKGNVFGGGEASYVTGASHKVTVKLQGETEVLGNVFGGGDEGIVEGSTEVNIMMPEPTPEP